MALIIDLGLRTFDVEDADGNIIGTIRMNPSDIGFIGRWQAFQDRAEKLADEPPATPWAMAQADQELKDLLDKVFAAPCSDVLFQGLSCFALCEDGRFVLTNVVEALMPEIKDAIIKAQKASEERMAKHTSVYEGSSAGLAPGQAVD